METAPITDLNSLWIGDIVYYLPQQKKARFEGKSSIGAIISIEGKSMTAALHDIVLITKEDEVITLVFDDDAPNTSLPKKKKINEIDLHLDKLNPDFKSTISETPIEYQLKCCQQFIEDAIHHKIKSITIIHGKGEGKLKLMVYNLVKSYPEVLWLDDIHNGGAVKVQLK